MATPRPNLAAGHRRLGARSHARLLDEQTEALTRIDAADRMLTELICWARAQHLELQSARSFALAANQRASGATYEAPAIEAVAS
jgi:hypothetical protein